MQLLTPISIIIGICFVLYSTVLLLETESDHFSRQLRRLNSKFSPKQDPALTGGKGDFKNTGDDDAQSIDPNGGGNSGFIAIGSGQGSDAECTATAMGVLGSFEAAEFPPLSGASWTDYPPPNLSRSATFICENVEACAVVNTRFIAEEQGIFPAYRRRLQTLSNTDTSRAFTMWVANVTFFLGNTTLELLYSQCMCERKAIQLAIHNVTSSAGQLKYVSLPTLALLTENGETFGSRKAIYRVHLRISSLISRSSLELVVVTLARSLTSPRPAPDNAITAAIRNNANDALLSKGAKSITKSFVCSSPSQCAVITSGSALPTAVPTQEPLIVGLSLKEQCEQFVTERFASAFWGLYGANYEVSYYSGNDIADAGVSGLQASRLSQKPSFYSVWLAILLSGWCIVACYVLWKLCIGYAALRTNWQACSKACVGPSRIHLFQAPSKAARQLMQICVVSIIVGCRVTYLSLVMTLTATQEYSSFSCIELSPFMTNGDRFPGTGVFFLLHGLYSPLLLLAVLLRAGLVYAVAEQVGMLLADPSQDPRANNSGQLRVRLVTVVAALVAVSCLLILFIMYAQTKSHDTGSYESAQSDNDIENLRHWSLVLQLVCSTTTIGVQLLLPKPAHISPESGLDSKLMRQLAAFATTVPNPQDAGSACRTQTVLPQRRHSQGDPRWSDDKTRSAGGESSLLYDHLRSKRSHSNSPYSSLAVACPANEGLHFRGNSSSSSASSADNTHESEAEDEICKRPATRRAEDSAHRKSFLVSEEARPKHRVHAASAPSSPQRASRSAGQKTKLPARASQVTSHISDTPTALGCARVYPPPPRVQDHFVWAVLTSTSVVCLLTAVPSITTGSWFGSFVLYSSLQRGLELLSACCCLRYVHVERSYLRQQFMAQCEHARVRFEQSDVTRNIENSAFVNIHASFPTADDADCTPVESGPSEGRSTSPRSWQNTLPPQNETARDLIRQNLLVADGATSPEISDNRISLKSPNRLSSSGDSRV